MSTFHFFIILRSTQIDCVLSFGGQRVHVDGFTPQRSENGSHDYQNSAEEAFEVERGFAMKNREKT